jgi:hypothetical protein
MATRRFKFGTRTLTAGAFCAPCEAAEMQAQTAAVTRSQFGPSAMPALDTGIESKVAPVEQAADPTVARWSGVIAVEGVMTGDGRMIENGALRWDDLPLPLRWDIEDDGAHAGAVVVGLIETVTRQDGGNIFATGFIDLVSDNGWQAAVLADKGMLRGVSIDPDEFDFEIRVKAELLDAGIGEEVDEDEMEDPEAMPEMPAADESGYVTVMEMRHDDEIMVAVDARLRAATLVDTPAFAQAMIALDEPLGVRPDTSNSEMLVASSLNPQIQDYMDELTASAATLTKPPARWFANPGLAGPTPITITDDGRIYGHLATFGSCHLGFESCVTPPKSSTNYAWFRTGILVADDGTEHAVGQITMNTGHAGTALNPSQTLAHYDNTGLAVADVTAGEDTHGIWVAGALRPTATDEQIRALRASPLSGDWRRVGGNLELVAALAVNVPGFVVPRGLVASGRQESLQLPAPSLDALVAAGYTPSAPDVIDVDDSMEFTAADRAELMELLASARRDRAEAAAELARAIEADDLARAMRA